MIDGRMTIANQPDPRPGPNRPPAGGSAFFIDVSAALIFLGGRLLITQRQVHSHLGGCWEFPGGKREADETFEQCLVREIKEELGLEIVVGELFEELCHRYPEKNVRLKFFLCRPQAGEPQPLACAALKWIDQAGLDAHEFPAADARLLEKLKTMPQLWR